MQHPIRDRVRRREVPAGVPVATFSCHSRLLLWSLTAATKAYGRAQAERLIGTDALRGLRESVAREGAGAMPPRL